MNSEPYLRSVLKLIPPFFRMSKCRHILILRFDIPLGNAVLAISTLRSLKNAYKDIEITAVASGHSLHLLKASPYVDSVISSPNPIKAPFFAFLFAITKIWPQRRKFDAVVLDSGNARTLITIFALLTGVKRRTGYSVRPWLLHVPIADRAVSSIIKKNNIAIETLLSCSLKVVEPKIFFYEKDYKVFDHVFDSVSVLRPRVVFVTETSRGHPNAWFADRFVSLARLLIRDYDAFISFVGTEVDRVQIDAIREDISSDAVSLAGRTSPRELAAFMACSDFCISVDTGAMHVARSVNLPTVIIGNAAQPLSLWLPPTDLNHIELIRKDNLPCSICWKLYCATRECMDEITVEDVALAFSRLKERVSWGADARAYRITNHSIIHDDAIVEVDEMRHKGIP